MKGLHDYKNSIIRQYFVFLSGLSLLFHESPFSNMGITFTYHPLNTHLKSTWEVRIKYDLCTSYIPVLRLLLMGDLLSKGENMTCTFAEVSIL
jgi:mRNA-degrading endonuclease YafQ of YafQ-DinJ toxin-antitoxin module